MPVIGGNAIQHGEAYEGMPADAELYNHVSKLNNTAAAIAYGRGVVSDTVDPDGSAMLPNGTSTAGKFIGVVVRELNRAYQEGQFFGAPVARDMTVRTAGPIWVRALVAVAKDDPVYLVIGDGTGVNQGRFSNVVGTGPTAAVLIPNAKWVKSGAAGALAKISLVIGG